MRSIFTLMTYKQLTKLGFEFEILPSGRINIKHKFPFMLNNIKTITSKNGQWKLTLDVKSIDNAVKYIDTIELL
jgi:hypothetical protein